MWTVRGRIRAGIERDIGGGVCGVQHLKKTDQVVIRGINDQLSHSMGGELFGLKRIALNEGGE